LAPSTVTYTGFPVADVRPLITPPRSGGSRTIILFAHV
jgi:hypothetical protein